MDKIYYITLLVDTYSELLTPKQRAVMTLYYFDDYSLNEIGEEMGITRQAVQDMIKRSEKLLKRYEEKLMLVDRYIKRKAKLEKALELIDNEIGSGNDRLKNIKDIISDLLD